MLSELQKLFLGNAPGWYKSTILGFLIINPILLLVLNIFISSYALAPIYSPDIWNINEMPIENETNSVSVNKLYKIAVKNKFKAEKSNNFKEALKKISSKEKKLIVCFGSLYNCGNILNKN